MEKYCKENISTRPEIYQDFYEILSNYVKKDCQSIIDNNLKEIEKINKLNESEKAKYSERVNELKDEIKRMEDLKKPYEQEMLKILKNYKNWKNIDPLIALNYANENWNVLENNDFFNYLSNVVRDYIIEGKNIKLQEILVKLVQFINKKIIVNYKKNMLLLTQKKHVIYVKKNWKYTFPRIS